MAYEGQVPWGRILIMDLALAAVCLILLALAVSLDRRIDELEGRLLAIGPPAAVSSAPFEDGSEACDYSRRLVYRWLRDNLWTHRQNHLAWAMKLEAEPPTEELRVALGDAEQQYEYVRMYDQRILALNVIAPGCGEQAS